MEPTTRHFLFDKTHLRVTGVRLFAVDLLEAARQVSIALDLPVGAAWVVYAAADRIDFDLQAKSVQLDDWNEARRRVLAALSSVEGISLTADADVTGEGILGSLNWQGQPSNTLQSDLELAERIQNLRRRRVSIWSTGTELLTGRIKDLNAPYLEKIARDSDLDVKSEGVLADRVGAIISGIEQSLGSGAGWIITTGGVGQSLGDYTLEALRRLDPSLAHVPIATFQHEGKHCVVEIGVGNCEGAFLIALPGPHDEVRACEPLLRKAFEGGLADKWELARGLANAVSGLFATRQKNSSNIQLIGDEITIREIVDNNAHARKD
ncbi:MAG: molybdopterin-binding protein [Propionibacteriaceae bacterium]|nr:molybdopterin-binding protein [Propionibacteriaceae bacterium]